MTAILRSSIFEERIVVSHAMNTQSRGNPPATYRDVLEAPSHKSAEIVRGALHLHPRPSPRHARAASALGGQVFNPFDEGHGGPGGWWILDEPELHLGADILVPDLAGWRRDRMPELPDAAFFELPPDWVCEVLSPATRAFDLTEKRDAYRINGVRHLWLVDPIDRTLEAFVLDNNRWALIAALHADEDVRVPPFDAVSFPLSRLWAD
jgi:Uma2 family endonuclease